MSKNPLFNLALIILALFVGYGVGKRGAPVSDSLTPFEKVEQSEDVAEINYKDKYLSMKVRFEQLNKVDFEEYLSLKSQKEKYNKANEILGKILVIFLAELGLKVSGEGRDYAEGMTHSPEKYAYKDSEEKESKSTKNKPPQSIAKAIEKETQKNWREKAKNIHQVSSLEDAQKFLDSVEIKNFNTELKVNNGMRKPHFSWIRGEYTGFIQFDDAEKERWDVEMSLTGELEGRKIIGNNSIKLSKNGEVFSHSSGNGHIDDYKAIKGHPNAIIVEAGGRHGYFQLFKASAMSQVIGNYYREGKVGEFHKVGKIFLDRR